VTGHLAPVQPVVHFGATAWLRRNARHRGDAVCIVDEGAHRTLTFGELNDRVNRLANALLDRGLARGDRVLVVSADNHRFAETWLACITAGLVCMPVNVRLTPTEVRTLCAAAPPRITFLDARQHDRLASTVDCPVVAYGDGYEALLGTGSAAEPAVEVAPEDIVGLSFTSGTTGRPKGVLQSSRMLTNLVLSRLLNYPPLPGETWYTASPMFHIAGLASLVAGVSAGYTSILAPRFDPARTLRWIRDDRINVCFLVPTMISDLLAVPGIGERRYDALRAVIYGAAPMTPDLLRRAVRTLGCEFVQLFGAGTESGLQTSLSWPDHQRALAGDEHLLLSVGRPAFGVELRLCDENLADVPAGAIGEIAVRSGMVMSGYLGQPAESAAALRDGWFRAGDLGRTDAEGYLYLAGRRTDMIIRGGENVYPMEIEAVLAEHPQVREVAVVGVPDERWGEVAHAFVVASGEPDEAALTAFARRTLAAHKVPERVHFRTELPRNASGKVVKSALRPST
jgi:acyl-CoA synthetase (AMP-forming)/AMP-acid ligase II